MNRRSKPRCVCAPDCSNITWKGPVCGSDGKTYKDECALLKAKCKGHPDLDVQYQGKCKSKYILFQICPPASEIPHFSKLHVPRIQRSFFFILSFLFSHFVSFFTKSSAVFVPAETCRDVLCPGISTCVVDQTNNAYCVTCNRICPEVMSPEQYLCGNDGIIYASACHLRRATCLLGRSIGVAYEGKCISKSATRDVRAPGLDSARAPPATCSEYCLSAVSPWPALQLFTLHFCQHSTEEGVLERGSVW